MKYILLLSVLLLSCGLPSTGPDVALDAGKDSTLLDTSLDSKTTVESPVDTCNRLVEWISIVASRCIDDIRDFWEYMEKVEESLRCREVIGIGDRRELLEECKPAMINLPCEELGETPASCIGQIQRAVPVEV